MSHESPQSEEVVFTEADQAELSEINAQLAEFDSISKAGLPPKEEMLKNQPLFARRHELQLKKQGRVEVALPPTEFSAEEDAAYALSVERMRKIALGELPDE